MTVETTQPSMNLPTVEMMRAELRRRLEEAGVDSAAQECWWILERALGLSTARQLADADRSLTEVELGRVNELAARRAARVPLQYLLGTQEFCGLEFEVDRSVLIPRPETELLVREIVRRRSRVANPLIVDVGTGSGCIAISLAQVLPGAKLYAIDLSAAALATAKKNASRHGVADAITWLEGDLLTPLAGSGLAGRVDVLVSNPPYIALSEWSSLQPEVRLYEPRMALVAGPRGTELHERLSCEAIPFLSPGGLLAMELGQGQHEEVVERIGAMPEYRWAEVIRDDAGIERVIIAERNRP